MKSPELEKLVNGAHPSAEGVQTAWIRRSPRFRLWHLMLAVLLFATLMTLGRNAIQVHREHQRLLSKQMDQLRKQKAEREITDHVRQAYPPESVNSKLFFQRLQTERRASRDIAAGEHPDSENNPGPTPDDAASTFPAERPRIAPPYRPGPGTPVGPRIRGWQPPFVETKDGSASEPSSSDDVPRS